LELLFSRQKGGLANPMDLVLPTLSLIVSGTWQVSHGELDRRITGLAGLPSEARYEAKPAREPIGSF
jgi:hypothetical protein